MFGGDVDHEALEMRGLAGLVTDDPGVVANPDDPSVVGEDAVLHRPPLLPGIEVLLRAREGRLSVFGMEHGGEERLLHPCFGRVPEDLLDAWADVRRRACRVRLVGVHDDRELLDELPVALLGRAERLERLGQLGGAFVDAPLERLDVLPKLRGHVIEGARQLAGLVLSHHG